MPLLAVAAATLHTERMIQSNKQDISPGSGSGHSQQELIFSSLTRSKKSDRQPPPPLPERPTPQTSNILHQPQPVYGVSNQAYNPHDQTGSGLSGSRLNTTCETTVSIPGEESDDQQEVIQVQILPQDENWGETTTAVTNVSDLEFNGIEEALAKWQIHPQKQSLCQRMNNFFGSVVITLLSLTAFMSPILMVSLPQLGVFKLRDRQLECDVTCDGMLISFSFKLLFLLIGSWAVFFRRPKSSLPRIFVFRSLVCLLVLVLILAFWLFYGVHLLEEKNTISYSDIVQFSLSLIDSLLFVHYLAVILIHLRQLSTSYYVKVLRSPDGESATYPLGELSVQRAASEILRRYYVDFPIYNPYLDVVPGHRQTKKSNYKVYELDGIPGNCTINDGNSTVASVSSKKEMKGGHTSHNERYYDEEEYERKVRKRRARLISAAEESFTHIRRMHQSLPGRDTKKSLAPYEAAQAVFPSLSRALQKYLRVTRQQPRHTMESILQHLSTCLSYDMSPRAFLEKYLVSSPVLQSDSELSTKHQPWSLVCDSILTSSITSGTIFQLRQGEVSLLCSVSSIPYIDMKEEIIDHKSNKFVLKMNSETSV